MNSLHCQCFRLQEQKILPLPVHLSQVVRLGNLLLLSKLFSTRGGDIDSILTCVFYVKFDVFNTDVGQEIYHVFKLSSSIKLFLNCQFLFRHKINCF